MGQNFVSEKLKKTVKDRGLKTKFVAEQLGVQVDTLRSYMNGKSQPRKPIIKLMSAFFDVGEDFFFQPLDGQ